MNIARKLLNGVDLSWIIEFCIQDRITNAENHYTAKGSWDMGVYQEGLWRY